MPEKRLRQARLGPYRPTCARPQPGYTERLSAGRATPLPPPAPGSTPLEYLKQHTSLEAPAIDMASFRPFWKVRSPLDRLHADELISWFEWRCASEFRNLYDKALGSEVKAGSLDGTGRGSGYRANLRPSDHRLMALRRLRDLQSQLDRKTLRLLEGVIVYELGWCEFGKRLRVHASTSKRRAIAAIKTLGTAW